VRKAPGKIDKLVASKHFVAATGMLVETIHVCESDVRDARLP
jgi:hypothetical protein